MTGQVADAQDLAQMAVARALDQAEKFDPDSHADRWVFRIAQRIWLNELRARAVRRGQGLHRVDELDLESRDPAVETNIFAREVLDAVMGLPEAQRATVLLVYVEEYAYREAAEILDIPIGTVMSRLAAARKSLKARLADAERSTG